VVDDGNIIVVEDGNVVVVKQGGEMQKGRNETFGNQTPFQCCATMVMVLPVLLLLQEMQKVAMKLGERQQQTRIVS
jgi:hypothetical protein